MRRVQIPFNGKVVEADQIDFEPEKEGWQELRLEDGTRLRARMVIGKVHRIVGEFNPDGDPMYVIGSTTVVMVDAPPNLRRQEAPHAG